MIKEYAEFERKRRDGNPNEEKRSSVRQSYAEFIKNNPTSEKPKTSEKDDIRYKTSSLPAPFQVAEKMRENVTDAMDRSKPVMDAAYTIGKLAHQEKQAEQKRIASLPLPLQYAEKMRTSAIKATDTALKQPVISDVHNSAVEQHKTNQIRQSILENGKKDNSEYFGIDFGKLLGPEHEFEYNKNWFVEGGERRKQIEAEYYYLDDETMAELDKIATGMNAEANLEGVTGFFNKGTSVEKATKQQIAAGEEARQRLRDKGYSYKQVQRWSRMRAEEQNQEFREQAQADLEAFAEEHPILASLESTAYKFATLPTDALLMAEGAYNGKIDTSSQFDTVMQADEMLRSAVSENIAEKSKIGAWFYNVGMSGIDSAVASVMPGGHLFLAADAATSTMRDLTNRGLSAEKAFFGGLAAGVFEGLFEKVSIGTFDSLQKVSPLDIKDVVKNVLKSTGVNASEEAATELANILYDTVMHGNSSQFNQLVEKYNGDKAKAFAELALQVGEAGLSGAVMGGGFGVTGSAIGYASNYGDVKATGQQIKSQGLADTVLEQGKTAPEKSRPNQAYQNAQKKLDKGKGLSDRDIGLVAYENLQYAQENAPELNGVFESAKTLEDVEALYNTERYRINYQMPISKEQTDSLKKLDADYKTAKTSLESFNKSGARAMFDSSLRNKTYSDADFVKTKMPTIGRTDDGKVVSVSSIENIDDGKLTVKTSEGKTQALEIKKDIKSVDAQTLWTNATENFPDAASAQAYIDNYDGGSIADYTKAFKDYYNLAATGLTLERINEQEIAPYYDLSEQAQAAAVEMGRKSMAFKKGVVDLTVRPKTKAQQLQMNMLDAIGKHTGLNFVVVENMKDEGFYKTGSNQVVLSLGSSKGHLLRTAGHETYHYVQTALSDRTEDIETFVLDTLKNNKGEKWVNDRLKYYEKLGYEGKQKQINELVADSLFDAFTNKRAVEQFAIKDQSLAQKISKHIKQLIADIKNILNKLKASGDYAEIKAWQDDLASLEKLNNMFLDVLDELAAKKNDNTNETIKADDKVLLSVKRFKLTESDIQKNILLVGKMDNVVALSGNEFAKGTVGLPEQVDAFFAKYNYSIENPDIGDVEISRRGAKDSIAHGIGRTKAASFAAVPYTIEKGKIIDYQKNWKGRQYDTIVLAAPISINDERYYQGVIVIRDNTTQRFYLHEVLTEKEDDASFKTGVGVKHTPGDASPSLISLLKKVRNVNNLDNNNIAFSVNRSVEETKDLIAVHNMQESELLKTLQLGGFPMPSIAIIKAQQGHSEYGPVSVVFNKSTIDPKANKNNKVYGGDAWTPTYPTIEYKVNDKVQDKISNLYYELYKKLGADEARPLYNYVYDMERQLNSNRGESGMIESLKDDESLMQLYLLQSGKGKVNPVIKQTVTELSEAEVEMYDYLISTIGKDVISEIKTPPGKKPLQYRTEFYEKNGEKVENAYKKMLRDNFGFTDEQIDNVINNMRKGDFVNLIKQTYQYMVNGKTTTKEETDSKATSEAIRNAIKDSGFNQWVDDLFKGVEEKSGIRNNADYFTSSGNRRSWEALHWENTLENVVKVMKSQNNGVAAFFSGHAIWGVSAKDYRSIDEIKADSDRLKSLPKDEYDAIKEGFGVRLTEIATSIMDRSESNQFIATDNAMECIVEAVRNSKTKSGILNELRQYRQLDVTETAVDDIVSLVSDISNMPTEYFEAKPQRAVGLDEIAYVVVPDTSTELVDTLKERGIETRTYTAGDETDRVRALNSDERVLFSRNRDTEYLTAVNNGDMETAQRMVDEAAENWSNGNRLYTTDNETGEILFEFYRSADGGRTVWNGHGNNQAQGVFLTSNKYIANAFDPDGKHITVYAKAENPFEIDANGEIYTAIPVNEDNASEWLSDIISYDTVWSDQENDYVVETTVDIDNLYPAAFEQGYDAVIVKNVKEGVGGGIATDVVLKDGGLQMKSADSVTYDDNGNVIPLSERFDENQEDIRYSRKRTVASGKKKSYTDEYRTSRMIWGNSKSTPVGTHWVAPLKSGGFAVYEKTEDGMVELFKSKTSKEARVKFERIYGKSIDELYGNLESIKARQGDDIWDLQLSRKRGDYDGNYKPLGSEEFRGFSDRSRTDSFASDKGISLKSIARDTSISEEASDYILDTKEYQEILDIVDQRFEATGRKELSPKAIDRLAGKLLTKSKSNYSIERLTERLTALFDYIANSRDLEWSEVTSIAAEISKDVLKESQTLDRSMQTEYADVLKLMRESKVYISPEVKQEVANNFGSYDNFKRMLGNKLKVTVTDTSAVPLDVFWRELSENRPEMFDADTNYLDMPSAIADFLDMTSPQYVNPYDIEMDMDEAAYDFALQIYDEYFNIPEVISETKKHQYEIERLKGKYNAKINELHNHYRERIKKLRKEKNNKIEATKALYRQRHEAYREKRNETQNKQKLRSSIYRTSKALVDKLVNPTDQKHIPQELISSVNEFAKAITESGVFTPDRAMRLKKAFKAIGENGTDADANLSTMYNEEFAEMFEELQDTIAGRRLTELNSSELETVRDTIKYVAHVVSMSNRAFSDGIKERLGVLQNDALEEFSKQNPDRKRVKFEIQKGLLKPITFFELLESPTLMELYENIRQGESKWYNTIASAKKRRQDAADKFNYKSWKKDTITIKPERLGGNVVLSIDEALSIYATANRQQGVDHLLLGGIVREEDAKKKLDRKKKAESVDVRSDNIPLTIKDISEITSKLTKEQRDYADNLVEYMSTDMASLGNEVSMRLFGIKKFNEQKYFPLKSASNFLFSKPAVESDARIKHMSMTKPTTPKANNPVVIGNFTETVMNHCNDMALYYSFCLPLEDFNRVYNFKTQPTTLERPTSIKQKIDAAYGSKANGYIKQLLTDINGGVTQQAGTGFVNKMIAKAKKNAVFGSLSVAVQQPSAVARAFLYVDPKYFVSSTFNKRDWDELKKYAPVAGVKEMGYFDTNVGKQAVDWMSEDGYDGLKEKAFALFKDKDYRDDKLSFLPSYMDRITWGHIWNAVKKETAHNNPNMGVKSEEFLTLAGKRFTYVIDRTQVYDSVFARSEWMRSKDTGVKVATAFMSEPLTNYNMLYSAAVKTRHGDVKFGAKALTAYLVSVAFNSMLKAFVTAGRDDDDDKSYWEKYLAHFVGGFVDEPLGMIPYLKDFVSLLQGYDSKRMDTQVLADVADAVMTFFNDDKSGWEKFKSVFGAVGVVAGIPFKNLVRDGEMIYRGVKDIFDGKKQPTTEKGIEYAVKDELGIDVPTKYDQLIEAYLERDEAHYEKVNNNLKASKSDSAISSGIKTAVKNKYQAGVITEVQATDVLQELLDYDKNKAYWTIDEWSSEEGDYAKYNDFSEAVRSGKNLNDVIAEYLDHGVTKKTLASQITKTFKKEYVELYRTDRAEASALRKRILDAYVELGYDRDDKADDITDWLEENK